MGISSVDYEGAKKNLLEEIPHWDFEQVKQDAHNTWVTQLDKINIELTNLTNGQILIKTLRSVNYF